jgi:ABC-2 type transport system ATP-binding protein
MGAGTAAAFDTLTDPARSATVDPGAGLAIRTRGLTKRFPGGQMAVQDLDLDVPRGAVYGFLGPNGSGKTTTIRMLLGLVTPTHGEHELLGRRMPGAAAAVLPQVGALVEGPAFHPYLSGWHNLVRLDAADRSVDPRTSRERVEVSLARVGLSAAGGKRYRNYSLGMRQRLGLAAALLRPRELLVLDEPTNGLDPQGTREVRNLVREVAAEGATVFVSSHLLSEIEQTCTHVGVMRQGRLVAQGSLEELRGATAPRVRIETPLPAQAGAVLERLGLAPVTADDHDHQVLADLGELPPERVTEALVLAGVPVRQLILERPDLEDLFVALTGEGFDVEQ